MPLPTFAERDHLIALYQRVQDAQDDYKQAAEAVAARTGRSPSALRKWVRALARDEAEKVMGEAQEILDLFDAESEGSLADGTLERVDATTGEILQAVDVARAVQTAGRMRHDWSGKVGGHG